MIFQVPEWIEATLKTMTNRAEVHGEERKAAASWHISIRSLNTILDTMAPDLRGLWVDAKQMTVDGLPPMLPLRMKDLEYPVKLPGKLFTGWTFHVDHGIEEHDPLAFGSCKVDDFKVTPFEGNTVDVDLRIGTSDVDAERLGLMGMKLQQKIRIKLIAPEPAAGDGKTPPTDGKPTLPLGDPPVTPEQALAESQG